MVKNPPANAGDAGGLGLISGSGRSPGVANGNPLLVFLPGKSHGQKKLEGYSPWGLKESDMTEHACTHVKRDFTFVKTIKDLGMWRLFWIIQSYEFLNSENLSQLRSERDVIMEEKSEKDLTLLTLKMEDSTKS